MAYVLVMLLGVFGGGISVYMALQVKRRKLDEQKRQQDADEQRIKRTLNEIEGFKAEQAEFEARVISFRELQDENTILKRDLQNVDVNLRKLQLDRDV